MDKKERREAHAGLLPEALQTDNFSYVRLTRELDGRPVREEETEELTGHAAPVQEAARLFTGEDPEQPEEEADGKKKKEKEKENTHLGHRARLRQRFREEGSFESFEDHQILEFLLMYGSPRKDVNPLAHELLKTFGSLKAVLEARPDMLIKSVKGIGEAQATLISMAVPLARVWEGCAIRGTKRITNRHELEAYCKGLLLGERQEKFFVICVDAQCRVLGRRIISQGSLSEVSAYPRSVMETALNYNAHSVFFSHNHPGGTCAPSTEDITSTIQLQRLLNGVGILLLDHIIVADAQTYSMAQHGDIDFRTRGKVI